MSDQSKLYIAGMGMITPIGAHTAMTAAAVRAGVSGYTECNFFDEDFNKVRMATVPDEALENCLDEEVLIGPMSARHARMLQMAKLAIRDISPKLPKDQKLPLFLAGPEPLAANDQALKMSFIKNLAVQTGINIDFEKCRINSVGRAGGLANLKLAFRFFESTDAKYALVGGVDSFYDKDALDYFVARKRLLGREAMDGFIPGEAAAFLLLTKEPSAAGTAERLPFIFEPANGSERGHMYSNETYTGDGLATAVTGAIGNARTSKIKTLYSSMNGESFFAKEHGVAMIRNHDAFDEKVKIEHPADCFGDLGAASGIVMVALSAMSILTKKGVAPFLVCCSSDREYRSAVVVHAS